MQTEQQLDFGVTLDNGDIGLGSDTNRKIKKKQQNKVNNQNSAQSVPQQQNKLQHLVGANSENYLLSRAANPHICIATVFFKGAALFNYLFLGYIFSSIITFIFTVVLGSLDFWVVKNISGRILVGLRWWSDFDQKGNQTWKFQSQNQRFSANAVDTSFFWTSQITATVLWGLLLLINVLQLDVFWVMLIGINFGFCFINLYGYYMCRGEHKKKIGKLKQQFGKAGLMHLAGRLM